MFEIVMGIDDFLIQLVKYCTNEKKIVEFKVIPRNEEAGLFIKTPDKSIRIKQIEFKVEIWLEFTEAKIDSILSYDNEKNSLAQVVSVEDFEVERTRM